MDPLATYTALATTDAATLNSDTLTYLRSLTNTLFDLQQLTGQDWIDATQVDKSGLVALQRTLGDAVTMINLTLRRVR